MGIGRVSEGPPVFPGARPDGLHPTENGVTEPSWVVNLADVSTSDHDLVGGKASKLGEVVRQGLPVPPGVVVTTRTYSDFIQVTGIGPAITAALGRIDPARPETVEPASRELRELFERTEFPAPMRASLATALETFAKEHSVVWCAVRSSATAEDLEGASFAGLQETYLNVRGTDAILDARSGECWGSLFTPRVLVYRAKQGVRPRGRRARRARPEDGRVDGERNPVHPGPEHRREPHDRRGRVTGSARRSSAARSPRTTTSSTGSRSGSSISNSPSRAFRIVRAEGGGNVRDDIPVAERSLQKLSDDRILRLASLARMIESHYRRPMDVEWCADGQHALHRAGPPVTTIPPAALHAGDPSPLRARRPGRRAGPDGGEGGAPSSRASGRAPGSSAARSAMLRTARDGPRSSPRGDPRHHDDDARHGARDGAGRGHRHRRGGDDLPRRDRLARARVCPASSGPGRPRPGSWEGAGDHRRREDGRGLRRDGTRRAAKAQPIPLPGSPSARRSTTALVPVTATKIYVNVGRAGEGRRVRPPARPGRRACCGSSSSSPPTSASIRSR